MIRTFAAIAAIALALATGAAMEANAQVVVVPVPPPPPPAVVYYDQVETRIVDVYGDYVLISNGLALLVPHNVAHREDLRVGDTVRVSYTVQNGRAVAQNLKVLDVGTGS